MKSKIVLALLSKAIFAQLQCFSSDGTLHEDHVPCNGSAEVTHCCQNRGACLTSGLCFMDFDHSINTGTCTDMTWANPVCFQKCIEANGRISHLSTLYRCDNNEWCCSPGGNITSCCPEGKRQFTIVDEGLIQNGSIFASGLTIAPVEAIATNSSGSRMVATETTVVTSLCPPPAQKTIYLPSEDFKSKGDIDKTRIRVGLGAGLGVGLPLLGLLAGAFFTLRRERNSNKELEQRLAALTDERNLNDFSQKPQPKYPQELSGHETRELPAAMVLAEMPGVSSDIRY